MTTTDTPYSDSFEQYNSNDAFSSTANTPPPVPAQLSADHIVGGTITGSNWVSSSANGVFNVYVGGLAAADAVGSFSKNGLGITGSLTMGNGNAYSGGANTGITLFEGTQASPSNQLAQFLPTELVLPGSVILGNQIVCPGYVDVGSVGQTAKFRYQPNSASFMEIFTGGINMWISTNTTTAIGQFSGSGLAVTGNITATGSVTGGSDERLKRNITNYTDDALAAIVATPVHTYNYNTDDTNAAPRVGLIAQEAPTQIVTPLDNGVNTYMGLDLMQMASMQWKAIQQLEARLAAAEAEIQKLKGGAVG